MFCHLSVVSISALSDRGLLRINHLCYCHDLRSFNIRSFGSWIASCSLYIGSPQSERRFNIRSFGSWIASRYNNDRMAHSDQVSISALSDRGLLLALALSVGEFIRSFNIRSFGSWIASRSGVDRDAFGA